MHGDFATPLKPRKANVFYFQESQGGIYLIIGLYVHVFYTEVLPLLNYDCTQTLLVTK